MFRDLARGFWRLTCAFGGIKFRRKLKSFVLLGPFLGEWKRFRSLGGDASFADIAPRLFDRASESQSGGGHYFYQDIWALTRLRELKPAEHHDVGSRLDGFVGQATTICPIIYWDIRPTQIELPNFQFRQGSILNLPLPDASVRSLSCLHTAEHIGLGRYGDPLDPHGTEKALRELQRVLAPGGQLLFSMPIGRERVEFNAQRIWHPEKPIRLLEQLQLAQFCVVDDAGKFQQNAHPHEFEESEYACGLYCFKKK